jgi:hypothetical protein
VGQQCPGQVLFSKKLLPEFNDQGFRFAFRVYFHREVVGFQVMDREFADVVNGSFRIFYLSNVDFA